jgi:hypothetical protein
MVGFAAKRLQTIAQGFSPGLQTRQMRPESGARGFVDANGRLIDAPPHSDATFRARVLIGLTQG